MPLILAPKIRSRNTVSYLTIRSWSSGTKRADLDEVKAVKRAAVIDSELVNAAAGEITKQVSNLFGPFLGWQVSTVAVGHSRRPDSFATQIAQSVANNLGLEFVQVFEHRYVPGVSHPRQNARLPPLIIKSAPREPVLIVDDIATSGWHIEEGVNVIRALGVQVVGVAWISGEIKGS